MPKYSACRAFLWQLIAKDRKSRFALRTALRTVYQRRQLLLQVACLTVLLLANNNGEAVLSRSCRAMSAMTFDSSPFPVARLSLYSACSSGGGGEIAFGRWGSMYFCDVCPVHHISINYFVICMIYELSSARV